MKNINKNINGCAGFIIVAPYIIVKSIHLVGTFLLLLLLLLISNLILNMKFFVALMVLVFIISIVLSYSIDKKHLIDFLCHFNRKNRVKNNIQSTLNADKIVMKHFIDISIIVVITFIITIKDTWYKILFDATTSTGIVNMFLSDLMIAWLGAILLCTKIVLSQTIQENANATLETHINRTETEQKIDKN